MYRRAPAEEEYIEKLVKIYQDAGLVEDSNSPYAAPVLLAKKKDGTWRFCVDYRALNMNTVTDSYQLPRVDDIFDSLSGNVLFSHFDCFSGYWQVRIADEDKHKTAFAIRSSLKQWTVMPFGLKNAPPTFQRAMDLALNKYLWKICLVYMDDIIIFSRTFDDHLRDINTIFEVFREHNLFLKLDKCHFCKLETNILGHYVLAEGIKPDLAKIKAVTNIPPPTNPTEVKAFLGLTGYYRKFIPKFAEAAYPMY